MFDNFLKLRRQCPRAHALCPANICDHLVKLILESEYVFELLRGLLVSLHDLKHPLFEQFVDLLDALAHAHFIDSARIVTSERALATDEFLA